MLVFTLGFLTGMLAVIVLGFIIMKKQKKEDDK